MNESCHCSAVMKSTEKLRIPVYLPMYKYFKYITVFFAHTIRNTMQRKTLRKLILEFSYKIKQILRINDFKLTEVDYYKQQTQSKPQNVSLIVFLKIKS